jgi:hypothetical protein
LLNQLAQMDGFLHVVRCFESDLVPHPAGSVDPGPSSFRSPESGGSGRRRPCRSATFGVTTC